MIGVFTRHQRPPVSGRRGLRVFQQLLDRAELRSNLFEISRLKGESLKESNEGRLFGLVDDATYRALPELFQAELQPYSRYFNECAEDFEYAKLHALADKLDRRSHELGERAGLVARGLSVFRMTETRWLHPLFTNTVPYVIMTARLLRKHPEARLTAVGASSLAGRLAGAKPRPGLAKLLSRLRPPRPGTFELLERTFLRNLAASRDVTPTFPPKRARRIAVIAYKERTLRRLETLAPALKKNLGAEIVVLGSTRGGVREENPLLDRLAAAGFPVCRQSDLITGPDAAILARTVGALARANASQFFSKDFNFKLEGFDLMPELRPELEDALFHGSTIAAVYAEIAARFLALAQPDLILHFEEWEINRALTHLADEKGIPSVSYYCISPDYYTPLIRRLPSRLLTSGEFLKRGYTGVGKWTADKIDVVGDPLVDQVTSLDRRAAKAELAKAFGLDTQKPLLMVITGYPDQWYAEEDFAALYARTVAAAEKLGAQLVVKVHPQQEPHEVAAAYPVLRAAHVKLVHKADLLKFAAACDAAVIPISTASTQIMLAGTPIVSMQPTHIQKQIDKLYGYARDAEIPILDVNDDPTEVLRALLPGGARREAQIAAGTKCVVRHVGPLDGKCAERVSAALDKLFKPRH